MTLSYAINLLTCIFEAIIILIFINTFTNYKEKVSRHTYIVGTLALAFLIFLSNQIMNLGLLNLVFVILFVFVIAFFINRQIKINIILSIISVLILTISEIIVLFVLTFITGLTVEQVTIINSSRTLGIILSKLLALVIFKILCAKHKNNTAFAMKTSYWILFFLMCSTSVVAIFLIFRLQYESNYVDMYNLSTWCSFGLLYSTFFALYLYERIAKQAEAESKQELFQQQIKAQSKHLDEILITQKQIKRLRHDLSNHLISIQTYFENHDYEAGLSYIKTMKDLTRISEDTIVTGNAALDAIINTKKNIALSKGIEFTTNIQIPENIFVDAVDICIIFGNALDNCIEACNKITDKPKTITLSLFYENDSLICKIVNTTQNANPFFKTTKKDKLNHGFGIENIKAALSKYENLFRINTTESEFILSFIIFKK